MNRQHFGPGSARGQAHLLGFAVAAACLVILAALVALATVDAMIAIALAVGIIVLATLGTDRAGAAAMFLAVFTAPMNIIRIVAGSASITLTDMAFFTATVLLLPTLFKQRVRAPFAFSAGMSAVVVIGILTSLLSASPVVSLAALVRFLTAALMVPVVFMAWRPSPRRIHALACAFVLGQLVSFAYVFVDPNPYQRVRAFGLTTHFNNFALAALLSLALIPFIVSMLPRGYRPFAVFAGLICAVCIWESGSRAALIVAAALMLLFPWAERSGKAAWFMALAGAAGLLFSSKILAADGESALGRLLGGSASVNSNRERTDALKLGWEKFNAHPIRGNGFIDVLAVHNIYLGFVVATGIFGLVALLIVLWSAVQPIFWGERPYGMIAYAALGYVMFGALSTNLWDRFVWIVLALVFAMRQWAEEPAGTAAPARPPGVPGTGKAGRQRLTG